MSVCDFKNFIDAILEGDVEEVKRRFKTEFINMTNKDAESALQIATSHSQFDIVNHLLKMGCSTETQKDRVPNLNNFVKGNLLGQGSFGQVFKCVDPENNFEFVVKEVLLVRANVSKEVKALENEVNIYTKLRHHRRIVRYFGTKKDENAMYITMEYMAEGSIKSLLDEDGPLPPILIAKYVKQVLEGLQFLHEQRIMHRDIKAANILRNKEDDIKLCDFGISKRLETISRQHVSNKTSGFDVALTCCGTCHWMAPEIINNKPHTFSADVWSLGITVVEMLTGNPPYHKLFYPAAILKISSTINVEYKLTQSIPKELKLFLNEMLVYDPSGRASIENLLQSKFILQELSQEMLQPEGQTEKKPTSLKTAPSLDAIIKETQLGRGHFVQVFRCLDQETGKLFVMKEAALKRGNIINEDVRYLTNEISIFSKLKRQRRIVRYLGTSRDDNVMYMFLHHMEGGSVKDQIDRSGHVHLDILDWYCEQILQGLQFLHENRIIHRNIKAENILRDGGDNVKLCDFSISKDLDKPGEEDQGTKETDAAYLWMAPEVLSKDPYTFSADVWSLGITVLEMLTGHPPYYNLGVMKMMVRMAMKEKVEYQLPLPEKLQSFLDQILVYHPSDRSSVQALLNSEFILGVPYFENVMPPTKSLEKDNLLGAGAFGRVYRYVDPDTHLPFAMKEINLTLDNNLIVKKKDFTHEINIFTKLRQHKRIVRYYGHEIEGFLMRIFMEYMEGGSIRDILEKNGPLSPNITKIYTKQILEGLQFLHRYKVIHRDIKGANILRDKEENVKLCDFGVSKCFGTMTYASLKNTPVTGEGLKTFAGTCYWMAPEVIKGDLYSHSADVWSLGITVVEMLTGYPPYHELAVMPAIFKIATQEKVTYKLDQPISEEFQSLMDQMLKYDPRKRAEINTLLRSTEMAGE